MEVLDGPTVTELIYRRYARNPHGWSYTVSPSSSHGFYDALITSEEDSWQLKLDTIFKPDPLVIGSRSEVDLRPYVVSLPFSFGYREMNPAVVRELGGHGTTTPGLVELLTSLAPVVPEAGRSYAHGPFVLTKGARPTHEQTQARLDEKLTSDMLRLMKSRFPAYG